MKTRKGADFKSLQLKLQGNYSSNIKMSNTNQFK